MNVALRPEAEADVVAASQYYDEADAVRRALLRPFPFAVFHVAGDDEIIVLRVIQSLSSDAQGEDEEQGGDVGTG